MIVTEVLEKLFLAEKHPRQVVTQGEGEFSLTCFEATGKWDLLARPAGSRAQMTDAKLGTRIELVTGRTNPIRIRMQQ